MALEDKDIFMAICARGQDVPIERIMEEYEKAKKLNMDIEKRFDDARHCVPEPAMPESAAVVEEINYEPQPKKKLNKRNLKVKPAEAIKDTAIFCCICGAERQSLTAKHIAGHGMTVAEYKSLCGYSPDQPLMSRQRLAKSQEIIARAQQARMAKRAENEG